MNDAPNLSVERSLELLGRVKETFASYATREEQHTRDFASRRHAVNRKHREDSSRAETSWNAKISEAEASFLQQETEVRGRFDRRRAKILRTQGKLTRNLPQRAKEAKGKWLAKLQMKELTADRDKASGLEAVTKEETIVAARLNRRKTEYVSLNHGARKLFAGYSSFLRILDEALATKPEIAPGGHEKLHEDLKKEVRIADDHLKTFRSFLAPRLFAVLPLAALITFVVAGALVLAYFMQLTPLAWSVAGSSAVVLIGLLFAAYQGGKKKAQPSVEAFATALARARQLHEATVQAAATHHAAERAKVEADYEVEHKAITEKWNWAATIENQFEGAARIKIDEQVPRMLARNDRMGAVPLRQIAEARTARLGKLREQAAAQRQEIDTAHDEALSELAGLEKTDWSRLDASWQRDVTGLAHDVSALNAAAQVPAWNSSTVNAWQPSKRFAGAAPFARLELNGEGQTVPKRLDASFHVPDTFPVSLTFPQRGCLLFETNETGHRTVIETLNNLILRILASMPPGKAAFTIIDPVGLGQSFAGLMHLADYEEALINRRIWTQRDQIEERLSELNEHIEKVIQMYLRNEYATITQYNEEAGSVAEKYHFLVIADFPANFTDVAARRLQSIAASGARCGVFTLIHWDQRQPLPDGFAPDELRKHSVCIRHEHGQLVLAGQQPGTKLVFDPAPTDELAAQFIHKLGKASVDSNRVEVPFSQIAPAPEELWTGDTTHELKVAIGRTGATKQQMLSIGKGTRQHALFAGKTGSGKSTLFHVIITNLALACSPEQVEFYLIDFKKGVEFKCYASKRLPHAKVVAIESDREFALSVLQRVDEELKRRGDLFRKFGAQDIAGYKRAGGTEPIPRSLLMIDEFQEFFVEDDQVAQTASVLFDRIVRQGRAFGIHVLLGSQTLGGAYTLARATLGQMVIRVALQCNEADAHLIMDENNSAPRLLSRPGEGIYNDAAGAVEGNSPFQVVWLSDEERDRRLDEITKLDEERRAPHAGPIVFEGNAPAEIRENHLLATALATAPAKAPLNPRCWLGAPNAIKGPTEAVFHRQGGNHLLVVGQRDEAITTMFGVAMLSLAAQHPAGSARFILFMGANPGSPDAEYLEKIAAAIPHPVTLVRGGDVAETMTALNTELQDRNGGDSSAAPAIFVFIHGLQRFKKLKHEDDFDFGGGSSEPNPGSVLNTLLSDGSSHGIHIIAAVDTFSNVGRFLSRKAQGEFEMRIVFQMSANDSASLIESPKASSLGLHRALLYNEHEGTLETFRPYAAPDAEWIAEAATQLQTRATPTEPSSLPAVG